MLNAKEEFIKHVGNKKVVCAKIIYDDSYGDNPSILILKENYSQEKYGVFIESLDFTYNDGYGGQQLYGLILYDVGYSERGEYDGAEWWEYKEMPTVQEVMNFMSGA